MYKTRAATLGVLLASAFGQAAAASSADSWLYILAAAAFVLAALRIGWRVNAPWWPDNGNSIGPSPTSAQPLMAARNAELLALGYGWGGVSLLSVYLLTALRWQHGWEYGLGMVLIGLLLWFFARSMTTAPWTAGRFRTLVAVSSAHALAALVGVIWLFASGKAASIKGDWAANIVFVAGGGLIVGISLLGLRTARLLQARISQTPVPARSTLA